MTEQTSREQPELVYEYRKGQGWVVRTCHTVSCVDRDGHPIVLEFRTPEPHERFMCSYVTANPATYMARFSYEDFKPAVHYDMAKLKVPFITIIPVGV